MKRVPAYVLCALILLTLSGITAFSASYSAASFTETCSLIQSADTTASVYDGSAETCLVKSMSQTISSHQTIVPASPKTADEFQTYILIGIMLLAVIGLGSGFLLFQIKTAKRNKKSRQKKEKEN